MRKFFSSLRLIKNNVGLGIPVAFSFILIALVIGGVSTRQSKLNVNAVEKFAQRPDVIANANPNSAYEVYAQNNGRVLQAASSCSKLGINFAVQGPVDSGSYGRAAQHSMGFSLEIAYNSDGVKSLASSFNTALDNGIIPIVRLCDAGSCGYGPNDGGNYANALNDLANQVGGREFYAIAGPNEPLGEPWAGGTEGDPVSVGRATAKFMNDVINGVSASNVKLLSPAFNLTNPGFLTLISTMDSAGANWNGLDAIAGNAYNLNGYSLPDNGTSTSYDRISKFINRINLTALSGRPVILTEIGMFESDKNPNYANTIPHQQALGNLASEIEILRGNSQVLGFLLFNSFGNNGSSDFVYNVMTDQELNNVNGSCGGVTNPPYPTSPGGGTPGGSNGASCNSNQAYCDSAIELSFEDYTGGCRTDRDEICDPPGGWNWYQDGLDGGGKCGDFTQTPVDGNPQTTCRVPEIRDISPAGDQQCSENLTSHGDKAMKMFTAFASINAGTCFDLGPSFSGGTAGFDVRVKQQVNPAYGEVKVYLGYTALAYNTVDGSNWNQVNWTEVKSIGTDSYDGTGFATRSITINIPPGQKSFCTRVNNEHAGVGINAFWDGGFITEGSDISCQTAEQTSKDDGISRHGGGQCACDDEGNSTPPGGTFDDTDPNKYDYDFAAYPGWHGEACDFYTETNGIDSENGELYASLELNKCSDNTNPGFTCSDGNNWTGGYSWTSCLKEFPLLNYLAAKDGTEENNFITDCELDNINNFSENGEYKDDGVLTINFTNEFPGAAQLMGGEGNVFMKVPRLGGAAACAYVNWEDYNQNLQISPELFDVRFHTGGFAVSQEDGSFLSYLINFLKDLFSGATITDSNSNEKKVEDVVPSDKLAEMGGAVCSNLPGGPVTKLNVSDTAVFDFAADGGTCESIIEQKNYELTPNDVCDTQFVYDREERETDHIAGANCTLSNFDVNGFEFKWDDFKDGPKSLVDLGIMIESGPPIDPTPGTCDPWAVTCNNGVSYIETSCDTQHLFEVVYGDGQGFTGWTTEACEPNGGIFNYEASSGCRIAPAYASTNLCGLPLTCEHNVSDLYDACRFNSGGNVTEISGDPYVAWERTEPWENLRIEGLDMAVSGAFRSELNNSPFLVNHENVGIEVKTCVSVYDLQKPGPSDPDLRVLGASTDKAYSDPQDAADISGKANYEGSVLSSSIDLSGDELFNTINDDIDKSHPKNLLANYMKFAPVKYNPTFRGNYSLADTRSPESSSEDGVSQVCFFMYYPYVGQIPRIHERLTYFLSNQQDEDPSKPYEQLIRNSAPQSANNNSNNTAEGANSEGRVLGIYDWVNRLLRKDDFKYLFIPVLNEGEEIDIQNCDRPNCDHFAANNTPYNDGLAVYLTEHGLLPAEITGDNTGNGNGSGPGGPGGPGQCNPGGPGGGPVTSPDDLVSPVDNVYVYQCYGPTYDSRNTTFYPELSNECYDLFNGVHRGAPGFDYGGNFGPFHSGIDLAPRPVTEQIPVYASGSGKVIGIKRNNNNCSTCGFGNSVLIEHKAGVYTRYAHLANFDKGDGTELQEGETVTSATQIGIMGNTGYSSERHLHFEVLSCARYDINCVLNPNHVVRRDRNSTPPIAFTPTPGGTDVSGTPPASTPVIGSGTVSPTPGICYEPGTPGGTNSHECLMKEIANFINSYDQYGGRIPWEMLYAINKKETSLACNASHYDLDANGNGTIEDDEIGWYTRRLNNCTGDPKQLAMYRDSNSISTDVRGITQFSTNTFKAVASNIYWEGGLNGTAAVQVGKFGYFNYRYNMPSNTENMLDACIGHFLDAGYRAQTSEQNTNLEPGANLMSYRSESFSRSRVVDSLCATAIMISDLVGSYNNGRYAPPEEWYSDPQKAERFLYAGAGPYHGVCLYDYGSGPVDYCAIAYGYYQEARAMNLQCDGSTGSGTTPTVTTPPEPGSAVQHFTFERNIDVIKINTNTLTPNLLYDQGNPKSVQDWARSGGHDIVVNTNFYHSNYAPSYYTKIDGNIISSDIANRNGTGYLGISGKNVKVEILQGNVNQAIQNASPNFEDFMQSSPIIAVTENTNQARSKTAIATGNNNELYIIIVQDEERGYTLKGLRLRLEALLRENQGTLRFRLDNTLNMDGGGSTGIFVNYNGINLSKGTGRAVPGVMVFND